MSVDAEKTAQSCLVASAALAIMLCIGLPLSAYVLRTLWTWYAVADFGARPLSWHAAFGVSFVVAYLTHQFDSNDERTPMNRAVGSILTDVITLGLGFLYHVVTRGLG